MPEERADSLSPPPPGHHSLDDPGAHELEPESDDQFTDAMSEQTRTRSHPRPVSPIPITRVERVDHEASYGEVPGTDAYEMRTEDARPDEVAFIDEVREPDTPVSAAPVSPRGQPIPKTVLEEVPASPVLGSISRTNSHKRHASDAQPDIVLQVEDTAVSPSVSRSPERLSIPAAMESSNDEEASGIPFPLIVPSQGLTNSGSPANHETRSSLEAPISQRVDDDDKEAMREEEPEAEDDGDGFGDDFDDFEEGDEDAEFGDFDDAGFEEAEITPAPPAPVQSLPQIAPLFPVLDFSNLGSSPDDIVSATKPYLDALFPPDEIDTSVLPAAPSETPIFLTQRSASLWSQLVAPPPLQPPNWIRSRIRRLFLVSLGVPVDLDEILPASKQKKLVLPSVALNSGRSSSDSRGLGGVDSLKAEANNSNMSVDSQGRPKERSGNSSRRKGPPPAPELDLVYARQLCTVTDEAMAGLTIDELKEHVRKLESMQETAKEVLEYWTKKTDERLGDREAFEGVIENLVQHARKVRK